MISNAEYLIQKLAEAKEKQSSYRGDISGAKYWAGVADTYHSLLEFFPGWANDGTTGYYVFYKEMTYDAALAAIRKTHEDFEEGQLNFHTEIEPEDTYWAGATAHTERYSDSDSDE
jgi:hypothetical protein